jgi:hypothetical protein
MLTSHTLLFSSKSALPLAYAIHEIPKQRLSVCLVPQFPPYSLVRLMISALSSITLY